MASSYIICGYKAVPTHFFREDTGHKDYDIAMCPDILVERKAYEQRLHMVRKLAERLWNEEDDES